MSDRNPAAPNPVSHADDVPALPPLSPRTPGASHAPIPGPPPGFATSADLAARTSVVAA